MKHNESRNTNSGVKRPNLAATAIFSLLVLIFFFDVLFRGRVFVSADALSNRALAGSGALFSQYVPYIFCGMPATLVNAWGAYLPDLSCEPFQQLSLICFI